MQVDNKGTGQENNSPAIEKFTTLTVQYKKKMTKKSYI